MELVVLTGRELDAERTNISKLGFSGTMKVPYETLVKRLGPPRVRAGRPAEWILRYRECVCCDHMILGSIYITDGTPAETRVWRTGGKLRAACVYSQLFPKKGAVGFLR